jgi:hypothetical protein
MTEDTKESGLNSFPLKHINIVTATTETSLLGYVKLAYSFMTSFLGTYLHRLVLLETNINAYSNCSASSQSDKKTKYTYFLNINFVNKLFLYL